MTLQLSGCICFHPNCVLHLNRWCSPLLLFLGLRLTPLCIVSVMVLLTEPILLPLLEGCHVLCNHSTIRVPPPLIPMRLFLQITLPESTNMSNVSLVIPLLLAHVLVVCSWQACRHLVFIPWLCDLICQLSMHLVSWLSPLWGRFLLRMDLGTLTPFLQLMCPLTPRLMGSSR